MDRYGRYRLVQDFRPALMQANQGAAVNRSKYWRPICYGIAEELDEKSNIMIRDSVFCNHSYFNINVRTGWTQPRPASGT
jgi:hypothetical protein